MGSESGSTETQLSHEAPTYYNMHNCSNDPPAEKCSAAGSHGSLDGW
jgi:hypothetical protein